MSSELSLLNRQRKRKIDLRLLRRIVLECLEALLKVEFELGIKIVSSAEMARVNEQYLQHAGPTDVITFNHLDAEQQKRIHGDIYVCIEEAVIQAKRFGTSWQEELVRYVVHGILHLLGYDDRTERLRQRMKRVEDKLMTQISQRFAFSRLQVRSEKKIDSSPRPSPQSTRRGRRGSGYG